MILIRMIHRSTRSGGPLQHWGACLRWIACGLALWVSPWLQAESPGPLPENVLKFGEQMYRDGVAPSGAPMAAFVSGELSVPGITFTCGSCHLRSGLGTSTGDPRTPPVTGATLFQLRYRDFPDLTQAERSELKLQPILQRPAYTEETLARALRTGLDPNGRKLLEAMPRYALSDPDMAMLIAYLKTLSAQPSPGVTATELRFATVITDEVSQADREAMLVPLDNFIAYYNPISARSGSQLYLKSGGTATAQAFRPISLARWVLKGPAKTWPRQLEAYQRKEPVFALLGGITYGSWQPIHDFCEAQRIPCLFPITDLPVIAEQDWYTLYFSKGYYQEGQTAARFLADRLDPSSDPGVIQIARDTPEGRALSAGFLEAWAELGRVPVKTVTLPPKAKITQELLQGRDPAAVLLWTGSDAYPALEAMARNAGPKPACYLSSSYLKQALWHLPEPARAFTYITYPYRHPSEEPKYARFATSWTTGLADLQNDSRIYTRSFTLLRILRQALKDMDRHHYRDTLLEVIGGHKDLLLPDYERLSFSPGQRYASQGCYIMQLSEGTDPQLLKRSPWLVH